MVTIEKEIVMKKLSEIKPYDRNPRIHDKTVDLLCKIIPKVGFNVPIVIDKDGVIVKGHARYEAAQRLQMDKVPCIVSHADPDAIRADRIADNKVSEFSEWIQEGLLHEVDMLDLDLDFAEFGLPKVAFDDLPSMSDFDPDIDEEETQELSDEEKRKKYEEFLERQAKLNAVEVKMTTEAAIRSAVEKQKHIPMAPKQYKKCVCEKCGHVMFVDKNVVWGIHGTIKK